MKVFSVSPPPSVDAGAAGSSAAGTESAEGFSHVLARQQSGPSSQALPSTQPSSTAPRSAGADNGSPEAHDASDHATQTPPEAGAPSAADVAAGQAVASSRDKFSAPASSSPLADMVRDLTARSRAVAASSLERSVAARDARQAGKPDSQTVAGLEDRHGRLENKQGVADPLTIAQDSAFARLDAEGIANHTPVSERGDTAGGPELAGQVATLVTPVIGARTATAASGSADARRAGTNEMVGHIPASGPVAPGHAVSAATPTATPAASLRELRPDGAADASKGRDGNVLTGRDGSLPARISDVPPGRDGNVLTRRSDTSQTRVDPSRTRVDAVQTRRNDAATQARQTDPFAPDARPLPGQAFEQLLSNTLAGGQSGAMPISTSGDAMAALNPVSALAPSVNGGTPGLSTPAALFTGSIPVPVGSPQWGPAFSEQMVQIGTQQGGTIQHAELRLDPPDLGPLRISISMQGEQATATFVSPHASVRAAVEAALPALMQALADAGISLGDTSVGEQDAREFAAQDSRRGAAGDGSESDEGQTPAQAVVPSRPRGLVDTFA